MFWYPVQRQMFPEIAQRISSSLGSGFSARSAVAVSIIPTGVGCSIGGYAGDAAPVTRLLSSAVDYLVTNPNAVNASDFAQINDNVLYTEGYCIDLLCRGRIDLYVPYANSVGVILEKASDARLDQAFNVINAIRAVHGVDIQHCVVTDRPIGVQDLFVTFCHILGLNPHDEYTTDLNQPLKLVEGGELIKELF